MVRCQMAAMKTTHTRDPGTYYIPNPFIFGKVHLELQKLQKHQTWPMSRAISIEVLRDNQSLCHLHSSSLCTFCSWTYAASFPYFLSLDEHYSFLLHESGLNPQAFTIAILQGPKCYSFLLVSSSVNSEACSVAYSDNSVHLGEALLALDDRAQRACTTR